MRLPLIRSGYRLVAATPLRPLLRTRLVQRMKRRVVVMPPELVADVLGELEAAGVRAWLIGGWGIDALLGEQTRRHGDIDLAFDASGDGERRTIEVLERLGFAQVGREPVTSWWWSERIALSDATGRVVDIHPVTLTAATVELDPRSGGVRLAEAEAFATGTVAGRPVGCLSPALQLELHRSYAPTEQDREDVALLCERFGLTTPLEYVNAGG